MSSIGTSFTDTSSDLDLDAESTAHARNPTKNAHIATEPFETVKGHNGPAPYALLSIDASSRLVSVPLRYSSQHISQGGCSPQTRFSKGSTHNASLRHLR